MKTGMVIDVDYGYGKYGDEDEEYLMLEVKQTDNWQCVQYFHKDNVPRVLAHFNVKKISKILHKTVELGEMANTTLNPNKLRYTLSDDWLYNDNKRKTLNLKWNNKFRGCYNCKNLQLKESDAVLECNKHNRFINGCDDYDCR